MPNTAQSTWSYPSDGKAVSLTVTVGNQQLGISKVLADGTSVARGQSLGTLTIPAGTKVLTVDSMVVDSNPNTDSLVVTYDLAGGAPGKQSFTLRAQAQQSGDTWGFNAVFNL